LAASSAPELGAVVEAVAAQVAAAEAAIEVKESAAKEEKDSTATEEKETAGNEPAASEARQGTDAPVKEEETPTLAEQVGIGCV